MSHPSHASRRPWLRSLVGLAVLGAPSIGAARMPAGSPPPVVYQKVLSQFGTVQPRDILADDAGCAYVLAARPGNDYATLVLKLDPAGDLVWSRWFDGSSHDIPGGMAIDDAGDVYVVGTTGSDDFPLLNPLQATPASVQYEAFVLKLSGLDGTQLYGTYFGASRSEWGNDIAVNDAGEMVIVGSTKSVDFPTVNPIQGQLAGYPYWGWTDAFIARISADGSQLLYSTFYGGYYSDEARGVALDRTGRIHLVGETESDDFPTANPLQPATGGERDAFAACLSADGGSVVYSTYLGGEDIESVRGIALGADGRLHLAGHTQSIHFPTTPGAFQETFVGAINGCEIPFGGKYNCDDAFVASLAPDGSALAYATDLGGHQVDHGYGLAVDDAGNAYASGHTKSDDFPPYSSGTFYSNFISRLDAGGSSLEYSFLHPTVTPSPAFVALDDDANIYAAATMDTPTVLVVMKLWGGQGCSGDVTTYCTAKTTSSGCTPAIGYSGLPSATAASGFEVRASQVEPDKPGLLFYGTIGPNAFPFQGGWLCLKPPFLRTPVQDSGASGSPPCAGVLTLDLNAAGVCASIGAGNPGWMQGWFRDPASPSTTGLTDALEWTVCP